MLDAEREERLAKLFRMALNVAPEALDTFIESHCGDDAELREELSGLLEEDAGGTAGILGQNLFRAQREVGGRVGPYRLLEVLGEGGMGTVHLAEQTEPVQRKVALKTIRLGMASDEVLARFDAERQALARMNHPGIAEIYDAGTTESGLPWFAMEYCPGSTLVAHCDNGRLSVDERIALLIGVCEAVQHAHQKGVIHRDLKPSNVLVTQRDHRPVPKVIDFGVARAVAGELTPEAWHTSAGDTVGTWLYMSPEQADPKGDVDTRADVWALGAMLHELLCGAPPFQADNVARIAAALLREEPKPPSRRLAELQAHAAEAVAKARRLDRNGLARRLAGDLDWIALKALERDRARRYASASELAADLRRHLTDEPVTAGPPTMGYRVGKFVRRNRVPVAAAVVALAGVFGGLLYGWRYEAAAREAESALREEAESKRDRELARTEFLVKGLFPGGDHSIRELLERITPQIPELFAGRPVAEASVHQTTGMAWLTLREPVKAQEEFERAYRIWTEIEGNDLDVFLALDGLIRAARLQDSEPRPQYIEHTLALAVDLATEEDPELGIALERLVGLLTDEDLTWEKAGDAMSAAARLVAPETDRRDQGLLVTRVLAEVATFLLAKGELTADEGWPEFERIARSVLDPESVDFLQFLWRFADMHLDADPPMPERAVELAEELRAKIDGELDEGHWLQAEARRILDAGAAMMDGRREE